LKERKIKSVREEGLELYLDSEDGATATFRLAEPGSSVSVTDKVGRVEYLG
jgi:predicted transcriptional regulator